MTCFRHICCRTDTYIVLLDVSPNLSLFYTWYYRRKHMICTWQTIYQVKRNLLEKFSLCKKLLGSSNLRYTYRKYFIFIKMKGLEVKLLGKRKKILTNMSYPLQRSLFYRFSFKKGILNVSILHKFNVWHIITKKNVQEGQKISKRKR